MKANTFHITLYNLAFLGTFLFALISVVAYLYRSHRVMQGFRQRQQAEVNDKHVNELRWLHRLQAGFGQLWLLWIPYTGVDYFYYHHQSALYAYYPFYLLLAVAINFLAAGIFLMPKPEKPARLPPASKPTPPAELLQKGAWLQKAVATNLLYQDADLSLGSLAEALEMFPHELSRVINVGLGKNFSDFINEYRIREVKQKMQDPAYDRMTLLGIALDSGFNSKTTFNRAFRQLTGKGPAEYKANLKKERTVL